MVDAVLHALLASIWGSGVPQGGYLLNNTQFNSVTYALSSKGLQLLSVYRIICFIDKQSLQTCLPEISPIAVGTNLTMLCS